MAASKVLAKILAATTVASLTLPIAPAVSAETTIFLNGFLNPPLADASSALQGRYSSGNLVNLRYPKFSPFVGAAINTGTNNLDATVQTTTSGPITVVGYSLGAAVIDSYLRRLATDTDAPGPDEIQFVMVENPLRPGGFVHSFLPTGTVIPIVDLRVQAPPDPIYNTTIVIQEYDGIADWPDDMLNLLAVANAAIGSGVFTPFLPSPHGAGVTADLDAVPEENITVEQNSNGTTTTTYLVPTAKLPLTYIFRLALPDAWVDGLDSILRPIIDAGYSRNVNNAAASIGPAETPGAAASAESAEAAMAEPAEAAMAEPAEAAMAEPAEAAGDLSDDAPALSVTEDIVDISDDEAYGATDTSTTRKPDSISDGESGLMVGPGSDDGLDDLVDSAMGSAAEESPDNAADDSADLTAPDERNQQLPESLMTAADSTPRVRSSTESESGPKPGVSSVSTYVTGAAASTA